MDAEKPTVKAMDPPVMPSHNPLPLSPSQQAQVRQVFYDRARRQCAEEIKGTGAFLRLGRPVVGEVGVASLAELVLPSHHLDINTLPPQTSTL